MSDKPVFSMSKFVNNEDRLSAMATYYCTLSESLEADNELLKAKVKDIQSLCMEFSSLGRVSIHQNEALKGLCESYSDIANQRHLTTNKG